MASQYFMDLLTVAIFLLVGYTVAMAERNGCNSTIPHGRVNRYTCEDIRNGQKCMYSCDHGYQTHRLSSWLFCDSHTGRWTLYNSYTVFMYNFPKFDEEILCSPRLCPKTIPNGILSENCEAIVNSLPCNYTCKNGYVKTIQTPLTCLPSARWNRDLFSLCTAKDGRQCSWILPDADLDLSCDRRPGSTCTYRCRSPHYSLYFPSTILCQETDLMWSHKHVCSSVKCPRSFPGGNMSVFCDMSEGSTCAAQCDYGYVARNNSMQVTCLSSGQWNPNPVNFCQKRTRCPPVNNDGFLDYGCDMSSGSVCIYKCNQGFTKYVNQILVACRDNGTWNIDLTGICVKDTLCPAYVANGWISSTCSRRVSETCSIICNLGYTLTLPGMTATCLSSGRWDADLSNVCVYENSVCPAFVSNGWISSTCSRHIGDICSVNCNLGYTLTLPGMSTTCLFTGEWDTDLSTVCVLQNRDSSSSESEAPASSNIIIPLTLAVAAVTTIIVGIIVVCFRCQRGCNGNRSPRDETSSSSHISTMYSVGQCRMGSNLNLLSGSQTSIQAHDVSPPPYAEVMKNNPANLGPPPSYEEVNASPSRFLPDSYI